jgi:hypothetical protein
MVLDIAKPFSEGGYLEIDRAVLAGRPGTTCGGRPLNDDIEGKLFTLLIGGVDGPRSGLRRIGWPLADGFGRGG